MWSIAIRTLTSDPAKLITALVGVVFSVVLVNIQGGLFLGLMQKASLLVDHGQADVWVGHHRMRNVDFPHDVPRRWVHRIKAVDGVERAEPYLVGHSTMTLPSGGFEVVFVVGVDEASLLGNTWNLVDGRPESIRETDGVILDEFEDAKLEHPAVGDVREIGGVRARVVGKSRGVMGFLVNPYVFTSFDRAARFIGTPADQCSYFLVKLKPGADAEEVCRTIQRRIPNVEALPADRYARISINYWMTRTGMGISFGAATLLGLAVGIMIVAQTLYAMVLDRLAEFGTLKAIGARERQILAMLLSQSAAMALAGSVIGIALVAAGQHWFSSPRAPIVIPAWLSIGSCLLVAVICLISSLVPYLRIRRLDPLMVLQSR